MSINKILGGIAAFGMFWILVLFVIISDAQAIPSFPGAEGGGAISVGGRGGIVIPVTTLANAGPGSLRACVDASGPRTCVFKVAGTINLTSPLHPVNPRITIAGQTAPGGGITLKGTDMAGSIFIIYSNNVVMRYIRLRKGMNPNCRGECGKNIDGGGGPHIFDHVSATWNEDEGLSMYGGKDITMSYNLVAEGLSPHATSVWVGGNSSVNSATRTDVDMHRNLMMNNSHRAPLGKIKSMRYVNNLEYNHDAWAIRISGGMDLDVINSKFKAGPIKPNPPWHEVAATSNPGVGAAAGIPSIYMSGNIGWHQSNPAGDQWLMTSSVSDLHGTENGPFPVARRRSTPLSAETYPITAIPVGDLEADVLPIVGASRRLDCEGKWVSNRDAVDIRLVAQYQQNTGISKLLTDESQVGGFPAIAAGTACLDTDKDGMPDAYEIIKGFSTTVANNNATGTGGYTQLENFLSGLTGVTPPPPGQKFQTADRVFVNATSASVRLTPGGTIIGSQVNNRQGIVDGSPTPGSNGVIYYNINFDTGADGWVGESLLSLVVDSDTPPTVVITSPVKAATVSGMYEITGTASDNTAVTGYQLRLDATSDLGTEDTSGSSSYSFIWDTTTVSNGPHFLTAKARDGAGNVTTSAAVTLTVNNLSGGNSFNVGETSIIGSNDTIPANLIVTRSISLASPATIESITMYAAATGGSVRFGIYDDTGTDGTPGSLKAESAGGSPGSTGFYTQSMVTPIALAPGTYWMAALTNGSFVTKGSSSGGNNRKDSHTFGAMPSIFGQIGNDAWRWSQYATFTPTVDIIAPTVSLTAPAAGNVSGASVAVSATAADAVGVLGVAFHAVPPGAAATDENIIGEEDTTSTYGVTWDTTALMNGPYTVFAIARDAAGNMKTSTGVAVTVANGLATPSGLAVNR